MLERVRGRLSYANVVATLALVLAIGTGGAYAASKIGAKDLKRITERTSRTVQLPAGEERAVAAVCRKNERAIGGGYRIVGFRPDVQVTTMRRSGPRRFKVDAGREAGSPPAALFTIVYCLRR